jgi:hypothetical protein
MATTWPLLPAVFTYCQQHRWGCVTHQSCLPPPPAHRQLPPGTHPPQQPIQKVGNVCCMFYLFLLLTLCGSTGLKHNKQHTTATTALSPLSRDVRHAGHNQGPKTTGETPQEGDPHGVLFTCTHHAPTDPPEPPCHRSPAHNNNGHPNPHPKGKDTTTGPTTHHTSHTANDES